jgi:hypothetical protein
MATVKYAVLFSLLTVFALSESSAQTTTDITLGDGGALGRYRTPAGTMSNIAFIAIHRTSDYRNHASTTQLQSRGFATLGIRTRFGNDEAAVNWELIALDIRAAVRFLRSQPGITRVVLIGHSGGGPSTSYYQALVENGPSYCQGPEKLVECQFTQADFQASDAADGMVFVEAHLANGINRLRSLNPTVVNEDQPFGPARNKTLDPFDPKHGFNPNGNSSYTKHFVDAYARGESRRMNGLIQEGLLMRREIELGLRDPADDAFVFWRDSARLSQLSTGVQCCTLKRTRLLRNDGTFSNPQIIQTVRVPEPGIKEDDEGEDGRQDLTLTSFLSANAIRSKHSYDRIDWCSSNNSTICAVRKISVPATVIAAQGHYFIRDGEQIFEELASSDKEFFVIEGMNHNLGNCTACATFHGTGPYTNIPANLWNYVAAWATAHVGN